MNLTIQKLKSFETIFKKDKNDKYFYLFFMFLIHIKKKKSGLENKAEYF